MACCRPLPVMSCRHRRTARWCKRCLSRRCLRTTRNPILSVWQYGLGRTAVLSTDGGERWASSWAKWPGHEKFYSQLIRWLMRPMGIRASTRLPRRFAMAGASDCERIEQGRRVSELFSICPVPSSVPISNRLLCRCRKQHRGVTSAALKHRKRAAIS